MTWKQFHGQGKLVTPNSVYDGEWVADQREGNGTLTFPNGCVYKGQWKKNLFNGTGVMTYAAGIAESYTGEWANNRKNGSGVLKYFNSDSYDGHFKENLVCFLSFLVVIYDFADYLNCKLSEFYCSPISEIVSRNWNIYLV